MNKLGWGRNLGPDGKEVLRQTFPSHIRTWSLCALGGLDASCSTGSEQTPNLPKVLPVSHPTSPRCQQAKPRILLTGKALASDLQRIPGHCSQSVSSQKGGIHAGHSLEQGIRWVTPMHTACMFLVMKSVPLCLPRRQ